MDAITRIAKNGYSESKRAGVAVEVVSASADRVSFSVGGQLYSLACVGEDAEQLDEMKSEEAPEGEEIK